jgi:putative membrane protein
MNAMKKGSFLARLLINALAFFIVSKLYDGMSVSSFGGAIVAAFIWGIINALLRPILMLLTLPVNVLTLGLFTLVINGVVLLVTDQLSGSLTITSFGAGVVAALFLSVVNVILSSIFVHDDEKKKK